MTNPELDLFLGATPHRRVRHWVSIGLLGLAVVTAFALFVRFWAGGDSPYFTANVTQGDLVPVFSARGTLHGQNETVLRAPQDGVIAALPGGPDGSIEAGQELASFDTGPLLSTLAADRTTLAGAQADLDKAKVSAEETHTRLDRYEGVWRRSGGRVPSLNEMEGARADAERAGFAIQTAMARVSAIQLQLRADQAKLADASLRAPFSGAIVARHVLPGQPVQAGTPLFTLATSLTPMLVQVPLSAADAARLAPGAKARVLLDTLPDKVHTARLQQVQPAADGDGQLAIFTLDPANGDTAAGTGDQALRPGMAGTLQIDLPPRQNVLLVPNAALAFSPAPPRGAPRTSIYLLNDDGQPRQVFVAAGATDGQQTEVLAPGLEAGARVITGWRHATDNHLASAASHGKP